MSVIVVAGPSGAGKSTLGAALAERLGCELVEGDDLHPRANIEKMAAGVPLDDADRAPWLAAIAARIGALEAARTGGVVTCSALRRAHRDTLRAGHPSVWFVYLDPPAAVLAARMVARPDHFMPPRLLGSQIATAQPLDVDEPGIRLDSSAPLPDLVEAVVRAMS